jgi:uncharacterized protein
VAEFAMDWQPKSSGSDARDALNQLRALLPPDLELDPDPIYEKWILSGDPRARSKTLVLSPDGASKAMLWECTSGSFYWRYRQDETGLLFSGSASLHDENGKEHRISAGDFVFFPAGTVMKWRIDDHVRKIAFLREPVWRFAVPALTFFNKVARKLGVARPAAGWTRISLPRQVLPRGEGHR